MLRSFSWLLLLASLSCAAEPVPDFNRDVRPILSNSCFKCHGPATQKAGVRLDTLEHAAKKGSVVPGKPDESAILGRITSNDAMERMPPPEAGEKLTDAQVKVLRAWIKNGAKYEKHWAYVPPAKVKDLKNPIDDLIHVKLAEAKIKPSPQADKSTLIRRVTLDLTGLLPTPAEVSAYLKDDSAEAYAKLVDRLLASKHYGERQARHWLDLARYADSNGYTVDGARSIWPYRDWVINALNDDMPFDQFTREQLAGDLLPKPTSSQLVATGFHRNTAYNEEGGADPEQFRVERTIDRTNTTATVWLGLTFNCAQCHDHKYDAISQKDYYSLYAFFNSLDETSTVVGGTPELEQKINDLMEKAKKLKSEGKLEEGKAVDSEVKKTQGKIPSSLILRERKAPRESFIQIRGDFLRKGDVVQPMYPSAFATGVEKKLTRLDLANWLTSKDNPITARVVVNREWQKFFGMGLVETENDFGLQGHLPTHPQLLDWLAVEFRDTGWSFKKLHRQIVLSEAYRRSSHARPELNQIDPKNKLLARQNRVRVEAEIIRDAALCATGLLSPKIGGPGVYPPMPKEVFAFTQSKQAWPESKGEDRYRRGMYTFLWRQSQHHLLTTFDAADAQVSCTRRNRSNTPLQALHLANDPAFVEFYETYGANLARQKLSDDEKLTTVFLRCFSREPTAKERERMVKFLQTESDATKRWTSVVRVLMNFDEFVMRE
jgi:Protein of unknown function (DUF1553)/Protein of unknown function (DUF1549)/Planctomycete cytochrome C